MELANNFETVVTKRYADFSGRAGRREYWFFQLMLLLLYLGSGVLVQLVPALGALATLALVFGLAVPALALSVRRLHDTDRSGWWLLITLVPLVGGIAFLVLAVLPGDPGSNRYGPAPDGASQSSEDTGERPPAPPRRSTVI